MTRKQNFIFYQDPSHSWLRVPTKKIKEFGIQDKISSFSFIRGKFAYLEEDVDAENFLQHVKMSNLQITITPKYIKKFNRGIRFNSSII
jgi:hypothetical protein